jgi:hypothetical protein
MGDAGGQLMNKPVGKGGQTTMVFDVTRRYPRAYVHRHKMHIRLNGFNAEGKFEIKNLIDQIYMLVDGQAPDKDLIIHRVPAESLRAANNIHKEAHLLAPSPHHM